jgi:GNAT superfamily N-acetyltransferase
MVSAESRSQRIITPAERRDLVPAMQALGASPWPEFLGHDEVVNRHWDLLYDAFADYQFALWDRADEEGDGVLAIGNCVPITWDANPARLPLGGVDAVLEDAARIAATGRGHGAASALMIVVAPSHLGKGLSRTCIRAMSAVAAAHGVAHLLAAVRPTEKHRYPLIPVESYSRWRRSNGTLRDPWLRAHEQVGGVMAGVAKSAAITVPGTVGERERWTGLPMPETGLYVVPGGLVPVEIDRVRDVGLYVEPGVWMTHAAQAPAYDGGD